MKFSISSAMIIFGPGLLLFFVGSNSLLHISLILMFFSSSFPIYIKNSQTSHLKSQTLTTLQLPMEKHKIVDKLSKDSSDMILMKRIMSKRGGVRKDYLSVDSLSDHIPFLR